MSEENPVQEKSEVELIKEAEDKVEKFIDDRLPFLRKQTEYETLKASKVEAIYKQMIYKRKIAEMNLETSEPKKEGKEGK